MVINYFSDFCFPGGIPVHQGLMAEELIKLGHKVNICIPWPLRYDMEENKDFIIQNIDRLEKIFPPLRNLIKIDSLEKMNSIIENADINHFHGSFSTNREFLGEAIEASPLKKNIYTFHSSFVNPKCKSDTEILKKRIKNISKIIAVSELVKDNVHRVFSDRIIEVVPNGYYKQYKVFETAAQHVFTVLFIGRVNKTKGADNLIKFARDIKGKTIKFIILGSAEFDDEYNQELEQIEKENINIEWIKQPLSFYETQQLYARADVLYFPSQMEGSSLVILDSIAYGVIPVTTHVGSVDDFLINGINSFISNYDDYETQRDAIFSLFESKSLYDEVKVNLLKTDIPTWKDSALQLEKMYKDQLAND